MAEPPPRARDLLGVDDTTAPGLALEETAAEGPAARLSRADAADASTLEAGDPGALAALGRGAPVDEIGDTEVGAPAGDTPGDALVQVRRGRGADAPPAIEGFRVREVLGRGGMGTVYAGEQDAPRRPVAIKVLHATSSAASARFWAEAEIMARLDHPGIAKVLEAGVADGHPYFVMERVVGETLDAYVRSAARPLRARLALFQQICDAVHHAHVKGVIHRDLKPSNVMVRDDGRVAVLDFGIARVASAGGTSSGDTQAGELIGTPIYMSPEQARLRPDEVDARSDVYTLGVIFYELVSGELPYDVRGKALPDVARAICHDPPRSLARRDPALRGDLTAIGDHALAKEPERRYQSAAALGDDVRRFLAGDTISVRAPGLAEQVRRAARRRPGAAIAIAAAAIATAAFAVVVTGLWLDARAARRQAEAERIAVAAARDALEDRNNQLVLDRAAAAIARDPTEALAWLGTLTARGVDPAAAWAIADEALGRGVAARVEAAHADEVRWVEAIAGGFVSGGYDGRARRWRDGEPAPIELAQLAGRVHAVRPSPDGTLIAIGGDAGVLRVVDPGGGVIATGRGLSGDVELVAWSADGRWLVAADDRGALWAWPRAGDGVSLAGPREGLESLDVAADGKSVVAGDNAARVWRWSLGPDAPVATSAAIGAGQVVAVWTRGDEVAAASADGTVARWRFAAVGGTGAMGLMPAEPPVSTGVALKTAAFAADGVAILGGVDGRVVRVALARDPGGGVATVVETIGHHAAQVRAIAIDAAAPNVATGSDDGVVQVWSFATRRHLILRGHGQRVREAAFAPGGGVLSGDSGGVVRRWDLARVPPTVLVGHGAPVERLAASPAGDALASVDGRGELRVWSIATGGGARRGDHGGPVTGVAFAANRVVTAGPDGTVAWWDLGDAAPALRVPAGAPVTALAASRDGRWVAVATTAGAIALHAGDGTRVALLAGHDGGTDAVGFSPDGALLASGGQDRVVRVWSTARPEAPALVLGPIDDDTRAVVFSPAGDRLIAAGDDGRIRAWTVRAGAIDPASFAIWTERRVAIRAVGLDPVSGRLDASWRDGHAVSIDLAPPHAVHQRPPRRDEDAPWLALARPAPVDVTARGDAILVTPRRDRTMPALHALVLDAIGAAAIAATVDPSLRGTDRAAGTPSSSPGTPAAGR